MNSSPFSGHLAHCSPLYSSLTKDRNERAGDDADGGGATCARAHVRLGGRALDKPAWQTKHDIPLQHQICPHPCLSVLVLHRLLSEVLDSQPLFPCSLCTGHRLLYTTCMHSIAWHHIPPIPHSQELFCLTCWPPLAFIAHF